MEKIKHRAVIKFLTKQGKNAQTIFNEMETFYGEQCPSKSMIYKWHALFKQGRESIEDDPRSGRPVEATTSDIVEKVEKIVLEDARLKKKQLSALVRVSDTTILRILHDHLGMTKVSARWVPRMLTPLQKQQRVDASKQFLELCGDEPAQILERIVTGDETWVHHFEPESKQESMQWHKKGTPPPKKFKVSESAGKLMATRDSLILEPTLIDNCVSKGKSEHFDCRNHIRVIQSMGDGDRLYICGTHAHNPKDWVVHANLTHLSRNTFVPGIGMGIAKCPYDPTDNSTAIWVEKGNPGDLPGLYSGTNAEFTKADTVIFRTDLYNLTTGRKEFTFKRTLKYDSKWLDKPNFVGSFDIGEYVFFFFRETAVEYINCGKSVYSRVARVCKKDTGGKNILAQNWATYLKARLNCSIPGEFPFYFNEIQSIYKVPGDDMRFYGTFTTSTNGLMGSAICSFSLKDIQAAFNGKFKEQATSSSAWLPVLTGRVPEPRPGTCVNDTETLPDNVLNFIRSHPLMDSAVMHENEKPVFFKRDLFFTRLVVDKLKVDIGGEILDYTVYYAGTNDGRVHKIVEWMKQTEETSSSILLDVFDVTPAEPIQVMEISKVHKALYVASDNRVKQIDLVMCNRRYDNCLRCVHDPYCGWDKDSNVCKPYAPGLLQDVSNSTGHICDSSIIKKKMVVTWGQSLHLGCFLKMPAVLASQTITWYHYSKEKGKYKIVFRPDKYVETSEHGLVIIAVIETDAGRYDCWMGGSLLCSYNVTVDAHRCTPPAKSNDYQKIYSDWCHEFEKYKSAMKTWERKQAQCSSRQNDSNQNSHPNEIYRSLV